MMYPPLADAQAAGLNQIVRQGEAGLARGISHQIEASGVMYGFQYDTFPRPICNVVMCFDYL
jgi:hypothetical protein